VAVAREMTKLHEEVIRGRVSEVLARVAGRELRGELVVVVRGATEPSRDDVAALLPRVRALVSAGLRKRDAAREVARAHGASANDLYRAYLIEQRPGDRGSEVLDVRDRPNGSTAAPPDEPSPDAG
jgi:16S rRNA (cytidine1402-2'-O)-methyltransferase